VIAKILELEKVYSNSWNSLQGHSRSSTMAAVDGAHTSTTSY